MQTQPARPRQVMAAEMTLGFDGQSAFTERRLWQPGPKLMLAKRWTGGDAVPIFAQPKLNGIRATASIDGLIMRGGGAIIALPHVTAALSPIFQNDPTLILDGEIYAHGVELAQIAGLARRQHAAPEARQLAFHAFDVISERPASERLETVARVCRSVRDDAVREVPTVHCRTPAELDRHYAECLGAAFEGQMMRLPDAPYVRGRTAVLLKRKPLAEPDDIKARWMTRHASTATQGP